MLRCSCTWNEQCIKNKWKSNHWGDLPGDPVVDSVFPVQGAWVQSLVRELKTHMVCDAWKGKKVTHTHTHTHTHTQNIIGLESPPSPSDRVGFISCDVWETSTVSWSSRQWAAVEVGRPVLLTVGLGRKELRPGVRRQEGGLSQLGCHCEITRWPCQWAALARRSR